MGIGNAHKYFEVYLDYILNKTKVLPIISDPTDVDTDGDGYTDDVDRDH